MQVRLGPPMPSDGPISPRNKLANLLANYRRYADALIIMPAELILIEAKIVATPGIVSTLELYGKLLPLTPELSEYRARRVRMMLLWAVNDATLATIARQHGIEVEVYTPDWVVQDLSARYGQHLRTTSPSWTPPGAAN